MDDIIYNKKSWLRRYKKNREQIQRLRDKVEFFEERIGSTPSANYSGMPKGSVHKTQVDLVDDKLELEERIKSLEQSGKEIRREILNVIDELNDVRYADVLEGLFIDLLSVYELAEYMGYSERHILTLYKTALEFVVIPSVDG